MHAFYIVVNNINNKFYYGTHTFSRTDAYLGGGVAIQNAVKKYGRKNFSITILKTFGSRKEAFNFEERFLKLYKISQNSNSYNLKNSALGGDTYSNQSDSRKKEISLKISLKVKNNTNSWKNYSGKKLELRKHEHSLTRKGKNNGMYGKTHTKDTKISISSKIEAKWKNGDFDKILTNERNSKISSTKKIKLTNIEFEALKKLYYIDKLTIKSISIEMNISINRLKRYIKEYGFTRKKTVSKSHSDKISAANRGKSNGRYKNGNHCKQY